MKEIEKRIKEEKVLNLIMKIKKMRLKIINIKAKNILNK